MEAAATGTSSNLRVSSTGAGFPDYTAPLAKAGPVLRLGKRHVQADQIGPCHSA